MKHWKNLLEYLKVSLMHMAALLPILIVLDFGMGIQLYRDYGFGTVVCFIAALIFYSIIYARYIHDR